MVLHITQWTIMYNKTSIIRVLDFSAICFFEYFLKFALFFELRAQTSDFLPCFFLRHPVSFRDVKEHVVICNF
jgi:hypothetical protein